MNHRNLQLRALLLAPLIVLGVTFSATAATAALAPSCVNLSTGNTTWSQTATAYNGCSSSKSIKLIWQYTNDSSCAALGVGSTRTYSAPYYAVVDRLDLC